jgi:hypothetical protein
LAAIDGRVKRTVTHKLSDMIDEELVACTERLLRGEEPPEFLQ